MMHCRGWKGLMFVLILAHALFCLATATTCTSPITVHSYRITPTPIAYNNSPTTGPSCFIESGDTLSCPVGGVLFDGNTGSAELDTSRVFAWNREVSIAFVIPSTKVRKVNLFFYNIPSSGIGLPPAELFWSNTNPLTPDTPLSHAIVGNQDLSQDDRTLQNVSLVVTTVTANYRYFRIRFTIPAETSRIDWILLSEVQLCGGAVVLPTTPITFLQPPSMEPPVPPGPDNVVSAANLSCTVANEGSFQWQWTPPPAITLSQMWVADGTRTSIVQLSQISAANAGDYSCQATFNGQSATTTIAVQLNQMLVPSPTTTATTDPVANLSCELYGYLTRQSPTITWNFGTDMLVNDSVFTITVQDGSHMIQNGGDIPRPSMRSVLTINCPNRTYAGPYVCSAGGSLRTITLEVTPPSITFLQPPSMEPPVPPGPDNVVSASNLSCTVINEGCFHWQWTPPPGITISQMWVADGTRTSIVQISQISAANAGDYTCRASFNGQSANTSIALQFIQMLVSSPNMTVTLGNPFVTLSCELYGYLMRQPPTITWNFGSDVLMNDTVFTITVQDGSHQIQNGGDTPRPSMRSVLTINHPNRTHEGSYNCSVSGISDAISLQVMKVIVNVKVVNATALLVSWSAVRNIQRYTIYYSAFSPVLYKVVDKLTIVVPSTKTSDIVVIRELTAGVEHQFQVAAEMGEKSKLTSVVFDELPFHLQMGPVSPCTAWNVEKTNLIRSYVHSGISEAISDRCNCTFQVDFIRKGTFYCWNSLNEVTYRSMIVGTATHRATQLLQFLEEWVNSEPALLVDQFGLWVGAKCPVRISSLSDPQCPGLTPPAGDPTLITRDPAVIQCVNACMYRLRGERFCT